MNKRTFINIFICANIGAILLYAHDQISHYIEHNVYPGDAWTIALYLVFSYAVALIACTPIVFLMNKYSLNKPLYILFASAIVIGLVVAFAHNGNVWQHYEGFIVGLLAGISFVLIERNNASNKSLKERDALKRAP